MLHDPRWSAHQSLAVALAHRACTGHATDVHEVVKRSRGGSVLDPENVKCLCRNCHEFTEREPALATELGFLKSRWTTG